MKRVLFFGFGVACHLMFLVVYAYLFLFITGLLAPRTIDGPGQASTGWAILVNTLLLLAFGVQHSVMARPAFKQWWTQYVPKPIERSVYVLISNLLMIAMFLLWVPMSQTIWNVEYRPLRCMLWAICFSGWLLVPAASLLINHFDLFGTRQVWLYLRRQAYTHLPFRTPLLYKVVRHPLYVGWLLAFWVTPTMTLGHLFFALIMTSYILIALRFEERDLTEAHGEKYAEYRRQVPMLIPARRSIRAAEPAVQTWN